MFDPYHKWLGIQPDQRPPTYYQLLGISPGEQDTEVIEEAAIRQTTHVRSYQRGPHAAHCTRILNEIAEARETLLNPAKRKEYDAKLAARTTITLAPPAPIAPAPVQVITPSAAVTGQPPAAIPLAPLIEPPALAPARPRRRREAAPTGPNWPLIAALGGGAFVALVALGVGGVVLWKMLGSSSGEQAARDKATEPTRFVTRRDPPAQPARAEPKPQPLPEPDPGPKPDQDQKPAPVEPPQPPRGPDLPAPLQEAALEGPESARFSMRHGLPFALALSPDAHNLLVSTGLDAEVWDLTTKQVVQRFEPHGSAINCVAFSPDGRYALTGHGALRTVNGKTTAYDTTIRLWDVTSGKLVRTFEGHEAQVHCLAFSPDGRRFLSGSGAYIAVEGKAEHVDCAMRLWDVDSGRELHTFGPLKNMVQSVAFGPQGRVLAASHGEIRSWEADTGFLKVSYNFPFLTSHATFRPDGTWIVGVWTGGEVRTRSLVERKELPCYKPASRNMPVCAIAVSADGRRALIATSDFQQRRSTVVLVDLEAGRELQAVEGLSGLVNKVALSADGRLGAYGNLERTVSLWDLSKYGPPGAPVPPVPPPVVAEKPQPVPDAVKQAEAEKVVKDLFKEDYAKKTPPARLALAAKLLQKGKETRDDPIARYVLLREARDIAAGAGDVTTSLAAVDEMATSFDIDVVAVKARALADTARAATTASTNKAVAEAALALVDRALAEEKYEGAQALVTTAEGAARRIPNNALVGQAQTRAQDVRTYRKEAEEATAALAALRRDPDDAQANLAAGRFLCLRKGDWDKGLPLLAKGSDAALQALAKKELAKPSEAAAQAELADGWWDRAEADKGTDKKPLHERAVYWYKQALPGLTGLTKAKVQKRLDQGTAVASVPGGAEAVGEVRRFNGHTGKILSVALTRDGSRALTAATDNTVRLWDTANGREVLQLALGGGDVKHAALAPGGRTAVVVGSDALIVFDATTGKQRWSRRGALYDTVAFADDHVFIVTYSRGGFEAFTIEDGLPFVRPMYGASNSTWGPCQSAAVSADGSLVAFVVQDGGLHLRNIAQRREVSSPRSLGIVGAMAFSPDGRYLVMARADNILHRLNMNTGQEASYWRGHTGRVTGLAFSADGRRLVSGGADRTVRVWDAHVAREIRRLTGHTDRITGVAISGDGRHIVSGSEDGTVRLWLVP